ncbi:hypothetical protein [uncultured Halopseudomonas sp.]|uniref:hypothetical protein n=1 Tax=uncultured Halopseudomonas sp. TaxID=2901193 RepID=UPI0030EB1515
MSAVLAHVMLTGLRGLLIIIFSGWTLLSDPLQGWLFLPLWMLASWLILSSSLEAARLRRRAWLEQYLLPGSWWVRWLHGGLLMLFWHLSWAVLLALFMLVRLLQLESVLWLLLASSLPLLWLLEAGLAKGLRDHAKPQLRTVLARRLLVPIAAGVLVLGYLLVMLNLSQPDMRGMGLAQALSVNLPTEHSNLTLLSLLQRSYQLFDITLQWSLQNALGDRDTGGTLGVLAWSLLLLGGGAFIWAWTRLLVGVATLRERITMATD